MQIIVNVLDASDGEDIFFVETEPSSTIAEVSRRLEFQSAIPASKQRLFYGERSLAPNETLGHYGIKADCIIVARTESASAQTPIIPDYERLRQQYLSSPEQLAQLRDQAPPLAEAVHDAARWQQMVEEVQRRRMELEMQRQQDQALLEADPFDVEAQTRIAEMIRLQQVDENLEQTREYHPEAFGRVTMLFIDVEVNGCKLKAFVDSGAQATIMSPTCAERCSIMRLLDTRFSGIAKGVGTAKILGRVHSATIKIGPSYFPSSFTVMEGKDVDLLLGLDMLKRYQACIDLGKNVLRIQGDEVPFLGEADIPKPDLERQAEPTVDGPDGTVIGGISGTVSKKSDQADTSANATSKDQPIGLSDQQRGQPSQADIEKLMDMGMGRAEALQALELANGNVDVAAGLMF